MFYFHFKEIEMEPNKITRLYANAAKNLSHSWLGAGPFMFAASQNLLGAAGAWDKETRAAGEVVVRAARRSGEETRAVSDTMNGAPLRGSSSRPSIPLVGGRARCG